jgi:maltose alpha-D-glucosyltransferase/alpha-amylase
MRRSFDYAAATAAAGARPDIPRDAIVARTRAWEHLASETFLAGYRTTIDRLAVTLLPRNPGVTTKVLGVYQAEKALYELDYELDNRPAWVGIPLAGLDRLLGAAAGPGGTGSRHA